MNLTMPANTIRNDIIHIIIYMSVSCILVPASRRNAVARLGYKCPVSPTNETILSKKPECKNRETHKNTL